VALAGTSVCTKLINDRLKWLSRILGWTPLCEEIETDPRARRFSGSALTAEQRPGKAYARRPAVF